MKADVLKDLPQKTEIITLVDLTEEQKVFYKEIQGRVRTRLQVTTGGETEEVKTKLKNEYMQLRKVCSYYIYWMISYINKITS